MRKVERQLIHLCSCIDRLGLFVGLRVLLANKRDTLTAALLGSDVVDGIESMSDLGKDHISKRNRATRLARRTETPYRYDITDQQLKVHCTLGINHASVLTLIGTLHNESHRQPLSNLRRDTPYPPSRL